MDLALPPSMVACLGLPYRLLPPLLWAALTPLLAHSAEIIELAPWRLAPGQTRTLPVEDLQRYSISGNAVRAAPLPAPSAVGTLLLKAVSTGTAELWVWKKDTSVLHLSIRVQASSAEETVETPLGRALGELREAGVTQAGERVILRGLVRSEQELARIHALEDAFPKQVENQTETATELLGPARNRLEDWLAQEKLGSALRVESLGNQLWVRGSAPDLSTRSGWEQKLRALFSGVHLDISTLPDSSRTLFFRVFLLELKKTAFRQLGLDWPSHLSGSLKIEGGSLFWSHAPSIDLTLRWLEGQGWAKILSQPELVVRVPGEAELFNGGEIPIEVRSKNGHRTGSWVDWKSYGISLKLRTIQSTSDQVRLEISTEMSELDRANGTDAIPALQSSRVKSQVDARIGEPLFLSGLLQEKSGTQERAWPLLGSLPILGRIFGSEDTTRNHSELVAVLVPLNAPPPAPRWVHEKAEPTTDHQVPENSEMRLETSHPSTAALSAHQQNWMSPQMARRGR